MPRTAANVRTVPTEKTCRGEARNSTHAEMPTACAPVTGRSSSRVRRKSADDEARSDGRRIGASDQNEQNDGTEEQDVPALALDAEALQQEAREAGGEQHVETRDHQQVIQPAPAKPRDQAAVELRRASQEQRRERAADVPTERVVLVGVRAVRLRGRAEQEAVREGQHRQHRPALALHQADALHRQAVARPGQRKLPFRRREVLALEPSGEANAVAAVGKRPRGRLAGEVDDDFRGERDPARAVEESPGAQHGARPRRLAAPEIVEDALERVRERAARIRPPEGVLRLARRDREARAAGEEARSEPEREEAEPGRRAALGPSRRQAEEREGAAEESAGLHLAADRPRAGEDPGHHAQRGPGGRRRPFLQDRANQDRRSRATRASTRCVNAKRS